MSLVRHVAIWMLLGGLGISAAAPAADPLGIRLEAGYNHDDNVTRSRGADKLSDDFLSFTLNKDFSFPVSEHTRLMLLGFVGAEEFRNHKGLSRYFLSIEAELQYRPSAEFGAPTFAVFGRTSADRYESDLRDGYRHSVGVSVRKSVTDRIDLSGALSYNVRDSKSSVFDTRDWAARVNADYSLMRNGTLYFGAEYRRGDTVSSARPMLIFVDLAKAIVRDDAYPGMNLFAYRLEARTIITTLGYNWAFAEGHALDFSWRWIEATATATPSFVTTDKVRYRDNQLSIAYLYRF
jgi:hypothetical protein